MLNDSWTKSVHHDGSPYYVVGKALQTGATLTLRLRADFAYEDILRVWQEAETLPAIEHAWLFDHPMPIMRADPAGPCLDGWTLLAALAAQTKRLRLGLMVASNANQTPALLAKRAATLDIISHGRLEFGLGAGGVEREHTAYGTDFFPPGERNYLLKKLRGQRLTPRQEECATLISQGLSNDEIALSMGFLNAQGKPNMGPLENMVSELYIFFAIDGAPSDPGRRVLLAHAYEAYAGLRPA